VMGGGIRLLRGELARFDNSQNIKMRGLLFERKATT
jgi:hypothetical protein